MSPHFEYSGRQTANKIYKTSVENECNEAIKSSRSDIVKKVILNATARIRNENTGIASVSE